MPANVSECQRMYYVIRGWYWLAGIGQQWLGVERVMGIEYIADVQISAANQIVAGDVVCRV
jgi:hypothetical protein